MVSRIAPEYSYQPGDQFVVEQGSTERARLSQLFTQGRGLGAVALGRAADRLGAVRTLGCAYLLAALTVWLLARADGSWVLVIIALAGAA